MGLTINYRHRTKDLKKIRLLIQNLKEFAENTGRAFSRGTSKVITRKHPPYGEKVHPKDDETAYSFYDTSLTHLRNEGPETTQIWCEIEIKSSRTSNDESEFLFVGWAKVGEYWICKDWHKIAGPATEATEQLANTVIEIVSILEYIKNYYFPDFKIDDETNFYINYDDQTESQKQFWKDIKQGKHLSYRQSDGTFPDYKTEYLAKKNHDIKNIFESIGDIQDVFGKVNTMLKDAGYGKEQIKTNIKINTPITGIREDLSHIGNKIVVNIKNDLQKYKVDYTRPKQITIPKPIQPIKRKLITRRDGVKQHYHKRLK